ncbi:MAG: CinA family protein [Pseudomonadota bacterium]
MADKRALAEKLVAVCTQSGDMIATAESCTGGLIAGAITDISGSSSVLDRGFVTYSNDAKTQMLGVAEDLIAHHGAVSAPVAEAMALGAIQHSRAAISIAVTGVAGPTGGSADKPVGTVWFGMCQRGQNPQSFHRHFAGEDRDGVRERTVIEALEALLGKAAP